MTRQKNGMKSVQKPFAVSLIRLVAVLVTVTLGFLLPLHQAGAVSIRDDPMDTTLVAAPPNIMFILDNSGSMDWEFMVQKEMDGTPTEDGKFENNIEYLFNSGDNFYSTSDGNGTILSGTDRLKWLSQWSGWNKIFYNPAMTYLPWPTMQDASTTTPRSNPMNATPTFNLGDSYYYLAASETAVIVDDRDGSPGFTKVGTHWQESGRTPEWDGGSIYTSTSGERATFTPNIVQPGNYAVYAWWNCYTDRDGNAKITIVHSDGSDTVYRSQRAANDNTAQTDICGQWISLGEYSFAIGTGGNVTIERHSGSTGSSTIVDAVKFVLQGSLSEDVDIKNAHYYTVDDLNSDGEWGASEPVYLVNFVDGVRHYYQVLDSNGVVASGELHPIVDLPDSVKPKLYDDGGAFVAYKSDAEDLQNFANWYSYYRRRELTAKAAVANSLTRLERVQVGFYSINGGSTGDVRQSVLPIRTESDTVIIDNLDSGVSTTGTWSNSSGANPYKNNSKYTSSTSNNSFQWRPTLPATGTYNVYGWWTYASTRDTNAPYTINHAGGSDTVRVDQRQNYSQWTLLGTYDFNAGTSGTVVLRRDSQSTGSSTNADAVMFELVNGSFTVDETNTLLSLLYGLNSHDSTPLRLALREVGKYYNQAESSTTLGTSPYALAANGGACQQSFAIVMTDGYWNGDTPSVGNQDGDQGSPYADNYSDTLADVAMKYYKTDLSSTLENEVPTNPCDPATRQHMVTYGVSFGVTGSLDTAAYHTCLLDGSTPVWPNPTSAYRYKIDDLYHATINGRGVFFSASNPEELVRALEDLMENIESRMASGASVSVNGEELGSDTVLYQASYNSGGWVGEVKAYPVDPTTGEILREDSDVLWSAADELQSISADDRLIATYNGTSSGVGFRYDALTAAQKAALDTDYETDPSLAQNIVNYIRGAEITGFRSRTRKLGDIVHSAPLFLGNTIYVGGNDGMLHAFDADTGRERFGYVPNLVFENLKHLTDTSYSHLFFVDLTASAQVNVPMGVDSTGTMLVGGLAKGGKGYFALDITNADSLDSSSSESDVAAMVKWEYPKAGVTDDDMGYSFSRAFIVRTYSVDHPWVVIFGNGYNSANGKAVLYILNVDGTLVRKLDTGVGSANGLSTPSLVDVNADHRVDYAYAGDLNGNLWKFDLRDADHANWNVAYGVDNNSDEKIVFADGDEPKPIFSAPGKPITIKPDVMRHCDKEGYIVVFGTGLYLGTDDRTNQNVQTVYGIWDYGDDADNAEYLGMFSSGLLSNQATHVTLLEQEELPQSPVTLFGHRIRLTTNYTPNWETVADSTEGQDPDPGSAESPPNTVHAGWYFDLPDPGERVIKDLMIRDGMVVFTSFTPNSSPCAGGGNSMVHEMNACTGARPLSESPQFDINDDGVIDETDRVNLGDADNPDWVSPTGKEFVGLLHPPVVLTMPDHKREMKVFSTSAGTTVTLMERGERRGIFYWVERTGP